MDTRVKHFFFKKAIDLLDAWKGRPPTDTSGKVESGLLNAKEPASTKKQPQQPRSLKADDTCPRGTSLASIKHIEVSLGQQPQFTDGPARFVVVNDGSKDCLALLVTEKFVAKSRDLYEDTYHLSGKQGPLQQIQRDTRDAEASMTLVEEALEVAMSQEQVEELRKNAEMRESALKKARQRKDEIEKDAELLESSVAASRAYTQWVLETAMREINLLASHRPLTPFAAADTEEEVAPNKDHSHPYNGNEIQSAAEDAQVPRQQRVLSQNDADVPASSDEVPDDEDSIRQAAWEDYNDKLETFHKVQAIFDDRQQSYETNLAKFQDGVKAGIYTMSRSEFDRYRVRHGQKITRALIDAEDALDAAKAYAQAVGATGSDYEQTNYFGNYEESMPESQMASYIASKDFSDICTWMANVPETCESNVYESVEVDSWDAKEVDHTDSISQIDFEEYRKPIDRWQYECALARGDGPEEYYLGPVNIESLERRHSFSPSRSRVNEWGMGV